MQTRLASIVMLAAATVLGCRTTQTMAAPIALESSPTTSIIGHWVLATPADSTGFAGAKQVDLVLAPESFRLTVAYHNRAPITLSRTLARADGGIVTLTPTASTPSAAVVGFAPGQPMTRIVTASGSTLILAPPTATVPIPSSVWYRIDAARIAGLAP